jgi:hypothetical protein
MATTVSQPRATRMDKMKYYTVTAPAGREYYVVTTRFRNLLVRGRRPAKNLQELYAELYVATEPFNIT